MYVKVEAFTVFAIAREFSSQYANKYVKLENT